MTKFAFSKYINIRVQNSQSLSTTDTDFASRRLSDLTFSRIWRVPPLTVTRYAKRYWLYKKGEELLCVSCLAILFQWKLRRQIEFPCEAFWNAAGGLFTLIIFAFSAWRAPFCLLYCLIRYFQWENRPNQKKRTDQKNAFRSDLDWRVWKRPYRRLPGFGFDYKDKSYWSP